MISQCMSRALQPSIQTAPSPPIGRIGDRQVPWQKLCLQMFFVVGKDKQIQLVRMLQTFEEMWEPMLFLRIGMSIEVTLKLYLSCKASSKTVD